MTSAYMSSQEKVDEVLADDNGDDCFGILPSIPQSKGACNAFLMKRKLKKKRIFVQSMKCCLISRQVKNYSAFE